MIIDDQSTDQTFHRANEYIHLTQKPNITILYNPINQGYGGNQKIGYHYAVRKGFDAVVLLHGDGQYAPEYLDYMIRPILNNEADVVLASRMLNKSDALKGKMPFYKWIGNQVLTSIQNWILGCHLAEFHTGYRAYRVSSLTTVPFEYDSNYFDFDTDILIQMLDTQNRILEIPIPTFYGDEISRVNGFKYGLLILLTSIQSRVMKWGIFYHPKFDYETGNTQYSLKLGYESSHTFALNHIKSRKIILDISYGPGLAAELAKNGIQTISMVQNISPEAREHSIKIIEKSIQTCEFTNIMQVDSILILDVIQHLKSPENFLQNLRDRFGKDSPEIIITTANIAFLPVRLSLFFGQYNYGRRGILDLSHVRLFTFSSLRRVLINNGYTIVAEDGLPAPYPLAIGDNCLARFLLKFNSFLIKLWKSLFSYQIAIIARPLPNLENLLENAQIAGKSRKQTP